MNISTTYRLLTDETDENTFCWSSSTTSSARHANYDYFQPKNRQLFVESYFDYDRNGFFQMVFDIWMIFWRIRSVAVIFLSIAMQGRVKSAKKA